MQKSLGELGLSGSQGSGRPPGSKCTYKSTYRSLTNKVLTLAEFAPTIT